MHSRWNSWTMIVRCSLLLALAKRLQMGATAFVSVTLLNLRRVRYISLNASCMVFGSRVDPYSVASPPRTPRVSVSAHKAPTSVSVTSPVMASGAAGAW
jgi:hypothetical protein